MTVYVGLEYYNTATPNIVGVFSDYDNALLYHITSMREIIVNYWDVPNNGKHNYQAYQFNKYLSTQDFYGCMIYFNGLSAIDRSYKSFDIVQAVSDPVHSGKFGFISGVNVFDAQMYHTNNIYSPTTSPSAPTPPAGIKQVDLFDAEEELDIVSGATCRGPSCSYYSQYAVPDRLDGTFICYQCKSFGYTD